MILPLEYSKQESTLKPADITEEYVRFLFHKSIVIEFIYIFE